jgi:hypothetical protein
LLERIAREPSLAALETVPAAGGRTSIQIRFRFSDVAEFNRWFPDEQTTVLLRDVRGRTAGGSYESYVSYHPERIDGARNALSVDAGAMAAALHSLVAGVRAPQTTRVP